MALEVPSLTDSTLSSGSHSLNPIDSFAQSNDPRALVSATVNLGGTFEDVTVKEVVIGESLLNPSAHTVVTLQSAMYTAPQNWDLLRCQPITISISDDNKSAGNPRTMLINQHVYRCDNRKFTSLNTGQVEELSLHSIDNAILKDAETIFEKSWKCSSPGAIVSEALQKIGVNRVVFSQGTTGPGRPYVAESIHPLQVVQQQASVALWNGDDPSYVHYNTIDQNSGQNIHHFRSLGELMSSKHEPYHLFAADTAITGGTSFSDAFNDKTFAPLPMRIAVSFNFPCDYDVLSDVLNGINCGGKYINDVKTFNLADGSFNSAMGALSTAGNIFKSLTNSGTAKQQNSCETNVEKYLLKRQARMGLLDRNKIALRITIPWSPWLHVGQMVHFHWYNRYDPSLEQYGSGKYMILHMTHNIQFGGYAVTNLDCIANTYGS
jgi:hypothetical protein